MPLQNSSEAHIYVPLNTTKFLRIERAQLPSDRGFGFFWAFMLFGFSIYSALYLGEKYFFTALFCALCVGVISLRTPALLRPLNLIWYRFGIVLGRVISPIVLGAIFFLLITPVSLLTRMFGRDELKLKPRPLESYWIDRSPPGPSPESFKNQF